MKQDELLQYYQEELVYIRQLGAKFAAAHPKIAGQLRPGANSIEDPHLARLTEAVSLANARIRQKLGDEFPQISDALLQTFHPDVLAPIPSMGIAQFEINPQNLTVQKSIPADTVLQSENVQGSPCYFKTCYPVQLLPLAVADAKLMSKPTIVPNISDVKDYASVLRLSLKGTQEGIALSFLQAPNRLRFFINASLQYAHALYELLFQHTVAVLIADSAADAKPIIVDPKMILQSVGFAEEEGMLPYDKRTFLGYRLLSEFFAFPEKFLFFDLVCLQKWLPQKLVHNDNVVEFYFYLDKTHPILEKKVNAGFFALGCTPIVNLFTKTSEPVMLTHAQTEYPLTPDARQSPESLEIYAVNQVTATTAAGSKIEFLPFYGVQHNSHAHYYHTIRKPAWETRDYPIEGTEAFIILSDREFNHFDTEKWAITAELFCTNRDLPGQLVFDSELPGLKFQSTAPDFVRKVACMTSLTPTRHPFLNQSGKWRYISHLILNHLPITDDAEGIAALRDLLKLYDFNQTNEHNNLWDGLLWIGSRTIFIHNPTKHRGNPFCQGIEITLVTDETKFASNNLYLLGCVLAHFFGLYATVNLFTQLVIKNWQKELYRFPPRVGDNPLARIS